MTHKQLVERWEGQLLHWKNAGNNLTLSEEYRNKALYYASSISALLIDLKDMDKQEDTSTYISIDEQLPNEIWHNAGEPNYNTPVVVINSEGKITYFGYYGPRSVESGERWAYVIDLVNNTTKKNIMTTDQKSEQYSSRLSNQSGVYTKGEIETAYVTGYSEAEQEAIKAFDIYLRNYQGVYASEKRYKALMDDFKNIVRGTLYHN